MAIRHVEIELRKTGNPVDLERANIVAAMLESRGTDIPLPSATPVAPEVIPQDTLGRSISEYKEGPLTPELVNTSPILRQNFRRTRKASRGRESSPSSTR